MVGRASIISQRIIALIIFMQGNSMDQSEDKSHSTHAELPPKTAQQILSERFEYYSKNNDINNQLCCYDHRYYQFKFFDKIQPDKLSIHSVVPFGDADRFRFSQIFEGFKAKKAASVEELGLESQQISRGVAAVLGMAICDTLGACTEFIPFRKSGLGVIKTGLKDVYHAIENGILQSRHGKIGVWTDDASMGLCMADSIFLNNYLFNPKHIRHMFTLWLYQGLDNGGRKRSIGLGGNISISIDEYLKKQEDYTDPGDGFNNGNGSLMRLAPVPVAYSDDLEKAVEYSGLQSLTTHNGNEAQECCRLMASIIVGLIHRKEAEDPKELLERICNQFQTKNDSVRCLARGQQQTPEIYEQLVKANRKFKKFNKSLLDRNWNWKDINHTYSPCRLKQQPGYIGSYCMDALAMALHTVYHAKSFLEVAVTNADMGGDCDTVGSIAGQIAGAMYGLNDEVMNLYTELEDFESGRYDVFLKAYKLAAKKQI